jgi:hypothetical protein
MSYTGSQIEQFSNPDVYFMGAPTGIPEGHVNDEGLPDSADNALAMTRDLFYTAAARAPQVTVLESPLLSDDASQFTFVVTGPDWAPCTVEATSDYAAWTVVTNSFLFGDSFQVVDETGDRGCRFYRVKLGGSYVGCQVGYIRKAVPVGLSMIANQLETLDNTVALLLPEVPEGTQLLKWIEGHQRWAGNTFNLGAWEDPDMTLHPGEGALIRNSSGAPFELRFVGEVNQAMHNRVPLQLSIRSSALPLAGGFCSRLGATPFGPGTQIFRLGKGDSGYTAYTWDGEEWNPCEPKIEIGESFWCRNSVNAFIWERLLWNWP